MQFSWPASTKGVNPVQNVGTNMKQHLKALIIVLVLAVLGVWGYNALFQKRLTETSSSIATLEVMEKEGVPNFRARDLDGRDIELYSYKDKVVILNFWASWCGPCIEEVPSLIKLVKEFKGNVQLIAISGDSSMKDIEVFMKSFPEMKGENIHIIYDEDRSLMKQFQVARLPESLVVNREHKLAKKIVGSIEWFNDDSVAYIRTLLQGP